MQHQEFLHPSYFKAKDDTPISSENIDPKSALIIVNFSKWNREIEDPLDIIDKDELINDNFTLKGQIGLAKYIEDLREERIARYKKT